jgi:REP element-mobilizing transposase RayT
MTQEDNGMSNPPHAHHLRTGQQLESGRIYLLTAVTHERQTIFKDWRIGRLVVHELRRAQESGDATSIAWVVMPDHFHWLIELHNGDLPKLMQSVKSRSARAINKERGRQETLWQKGYFDRVLRRDEDLKSAARYIIANPMRAGLVAHVGDYSLWDAIWI